MLKMLICIYLTLCFCSCNSQVQTVPKGDFVAYFDYFTYTGEDDFYKNNPLSDNSQFYNPILPGWYSDPSICTNGEDYFLVTSTFVYYPGVPIFHSKDLVNWKQIGHVLDRPSQLEKFQGQHVSGGIFAPDISYNPHNQTYYMITTNVGAGNFFVKTKDPFGEWSEPIYLPEVGGIDPSFFFDDDGRAYIINNDGMDGKELYDGHRSIRVREFDVKTDKTVGEWKMLVNGGVNLAEKPIWIEGPHIYKIKGEYYLMAAEGGTGPNHTEVIFKGDSPMGTFKPWDKNPILTQKHLQGNRPNPITCAGHADLVQTKEGDWWAVFLACRPIDNKFENLGRETFIMPVRWSDDGYPYMTKDDEVIPMILKRENVTRGADVTFGNFDWRDDFNSASLGLEWMTLRAPAEDLYSLTENQGYLSLKSSDIKVTDKKTPAFLTRRMQHHKFVATSRMYFNPSDDQDVAGILLFKDEKHYLFFSIQGLENEKGIRVEQVNGEGNSSVLAHSTLPLQKDQPVDLKVVSNGTDYDFYYSTDGNNWQQVAQGVSTQVLSSANAGGFTGTTIGMYATKSSEK
nr:glycoside hydrolase family 43 protein [Dysgonomonas sp. 521]